MCCVCATPVPLEITMLAPLAPGRRRPLRFRETVPVSIALRDRARGRSLHLPNPPRDLPCSLRSERLPRKPRRDVRVGHLARDARLRGALPLEHVRVGARRPRRGPRAPATGERALERLVEPDLRRWCPRARAEMAATPSDDPPRNGCDRDRAEH